MDRYTWTHKWITQCRTSFWLNYEDLVEQKMLIIMFFSISDVSLMEIFYYPLLVVLLILPERGFCKSLIYPQAVMHQRGWDSLCGLETGWMDIFDWLVYWSCDCKRKKLLFLHEILLGLFLPILRKHNITVYSESHWVSNSCWYK